MHYFRLIKNPHRIPMGLWGWKIIPIPTPYPYLRGSPYPRQPCQKAYSEFEMFGHAESTVDLLHRTDKLCNTCITNLSDEIWAQQWRRELTHRPTDCVWRRSRDAEWVWSSGRCSSSAWPRRRKAHLSSRSASVGPRPWSSSAPSAAPSSVASDLSTYQSKKDNQNSASAWSHILDGHVRHVLVRDRKRLFHHKWQHSNTAEINKIR